MRRRHHLAQTQKRKGGIGEAHDNHCASLPISIKTTIHHRALYEAPLPPSLRSIMIESCVRASVYMRACSALFETVKREADGWYSLEAGGGEGVGASCMCDVCFRVEGES